MKVALLILLFLINGDLSSQVTYYQNIAPILDKHCTSCHREGDIGPMPLTSYDEVASYASMIKFVTDTKLMPPFKPDHSKIAFANERSISDVERELLARWINEGLEKGVEPKIDSTKSQKPQKNYDHTICMTESFEHYGIYYDQYQVFPLDVNLPENKYIKNIYFEPGNKEIVRSAIVSVAPKDASQEIDAWDPRYGFFAYGGLGFTSSFPNWFNWMPHTESLVLSENEKLYLPSDSELLLHIHYGPYGEVESDSSCIHLTFSEEQGSILQNVPMMHHSLLDSFIIEGGLKKRVSSMFELPIDANLKSITPLAHLLCRNWEVFAVLPDKSSLSLLSIEDWDFHWREKYKFGENISLPKGTKIYCTVIFDNTSENPYNPSEPPRTMKAGPHMFDENFECFFEFGVEPSDKGYIIKPFVTKEKVLNKISFQINSVDNFSIILYNLDNQNHKLITNKKYDVGTHTINYSSDFPTSPGRYCIALNSSNGVIDQWWFVLFP